MSFAPVVEAVNLHMSLESWWLIMHGDGAAIWQGGADGDLCRVTIRGKVTTDGIASADKLWTYTGVTGIEITPELAEKLIDVARHMYEPQWRDYIRRKWLDLVAEGQA